MASTDHILWTLARSRHGVVNIRRAQAHGISRATLSRQARRSRATRVHRGVYYMGSGPVPDLARCQAALDACGDDAAICGWMAAWLHDLIDTPPRTIDVLTRTHRRGHDGVRTHTRPALGESDVRIVDGLRVVSVELLLVELAAWNATAGRLARVIHEASFRRTLCLRRLRSTIDAAGARHGLRGLDLALSMHEDGSTGNRSRFEEETSELVIDVPGVPRAICTRVVRAGISVEPDLYYSALDLMVEIDDWSHDRPTTRRQDAANDRRLRADGVTVVRIRWDAIPDGVARANREIVARCMARGLPVPRAMQRRAARS